MAQSTATYVAFSLLSQGHIVKIDLVLSLLTLNLALQNDPGGMRTAWLVLSFAWGAIYLFGAFFGEQDE